MDLIGERVVCIKERTLDDRIKVGKLYTIIEYSGKIGSDGNEYYVIATDSGGKIGWLDHKHFKLVSEIREDKLKELGI